MNPYLNQVEFSKQIIQIISPDGGSAKISQYGAHVLSWTTADGREQLFLSPKAEFRPGAAIRGGVPVIFPQFSGLGNLPKHGFARTMTWDLARSKADSAVFWLSDSDSSLSIWPYHFLVEYSIRIDYEKLEMMLSVINTDPARFTFTCALHTYLSVMDVTKTTVKGLQGVTYRDSANGGVVIKEASEQVEFHGEVDRIYLDAPRALELVDEDRSLSILHEGFPDAVIWNPGAEKCALLGDMEPEGYRKFACVESAAIGRPVNLGAGETWTGRQILSL